MTELKKEKPIYTRKIGTLFLNKANYEAIKINEKIKSEEELPEYYITSLFRRNEDLRVEAYAALDIIEKLLKATKEQISKDTITRKLENK